MSDSNNIETATLVALQSIATDLHTIAVALRTLSLAPAPGGGIAVGSTTPINVKIVEFGAELRTRSS